MRSQPRWPPTRARAGLLTAAAVGVLLASAASGQDYRETNVRKGTLEGDQYLAGMLVDVHGRVEGDLTMAGLQAGLDGVATGDVNVAGLVVHVGGIVGDDVRALGGQVVVQGFVGDGLLVGGGDVTLTRGTRVGGTALIAGRRVIVHGDVGKDLRVAGSHVELHGDVAGATRILSDEVVVGPRARILGDLVIRGSGAPRIAEGARVAGKITVEPPGGRDLRSMLVATLRAVLLQVGMLAVAWAWMAIAPALARESVFLEWRRPGLAETLGVGAVAGMPLAAVLAALTIVGLPLAIAFGAAWMLLVLVGYSSSAICLGAWLRARTGGSPSGRVARLAWTFAALLLLRGAASVPVVGWAITLGAALAGAGAVAGAARTAWEERQVLSFEDAREGTTPAGESSGGGAPPGVDRSARCGSGSTAAGDESPTGAPRT